MKANNPQTPEERSDYSPRPLSEVLTEIAKRSHATVTVGAIRDELGDRGFAALLILFAAINMLPLPPGTSMVLGIPLVIVSAQMLFGKQTAWLPHFILSKSFSAKSFGKMSTRIAPHLHRLERIVQPRYWPFPRASTDRYIGFVSFILAVAVVIPVPFGNWLPAFAIAIIGVALSERDGILLLAGAIIGIVSLAVIGGVIGAAGAIALAIAG